MKVILIIVLSLVALTTYYLHSDNMINWFTNKSKEGPVVATEDDQNGTKEIGKNADLDLNLNIRIERAWQLPARLKEISGLAYIGENKFACVQDEEGTIFIYNASRETIEKEIAFGPSGDYEGIAVAGANAYVVTSEGKITEILNYQSEKPSVKLYSTALTTKENVEGLCFDEKNNRLLLAGKGEDANSKEFKGIYSFNLAAKKFVGQAVYKIDLSDVIFKNNKQKKKAKSAINPSGISVNPITGDIYIVDGRNPQLLVMDANSNIKSLIPLTDKAFSQPEGCAFNSQGELFISNEGRKENGNILKVSLN